MTRIYIIQSESGMDHYRAGLTGERIGWIVFSTPASFTYVHRVLVDPHVGPVIIAGDEVYEVPLDIEIYRTEHEAREAFWARAGRA